MKTFQEFMLECNSVQESSLNRIRTKSQKGGTAIVSAERGNKSSAENRARSQQMDRDIRGKGLPGATKVSGRYDERGDDGKTTKVKERSHVVSSGKMGKRKFSKAVKSLGKKYGQDSVLIQKKPGGSASLKATRKGGLGGAKSINVGKMQPGKTGEADTKIKGKTFTYG